MVVPGDRQPAGRAMTKAEQLLARILEGRTIVGRDIMKKVEELYADARSEEISEEEREWLMRINHIWKHGLAKNLSREIV